jgi:hypothetical protein
VAAIMSNQRRVWFVTGKPGDGSASRQGKSVCTGAEGRLNRCDQIGRAKHWVARDNTSLAVSKTDTQPECTFSLCAAQQQQYMQRFESRSSSSNKPDRMFRPTLVSPWASCPEKDSIAQGPRACQSRSEPLVWCVEAWERWLMK